MAKYQRRVINAFLRDLREFGYPDLQEKSVVAAMDCFFEGREAKNVIEIIVARELRQAGAKPDNRAGAVGRRMARDQQRKN